MRLIILGCWIIIMGTQLISAQSSEELKLIEEGVELHENELYIDAIRKYEEAMKINSRSLSAKYELAYTWYTLGNYEKSKELSKQVVDAFDQYWVDAVMLYGSSLDNLGKTKRALKLYETAVAKEPGHQLLRYNLALSYFEVGMFAEAEEHVVFSIGLNPGHSSSHLLLANTMLAMGERMKSMLALYYFLLIEQDTDRSLDAYNVLAAIWGNLTAIPNSDNGKSFMSEEDGFRKLEKLLINMPKDSTIFDIPSLERFDIQTQYFVNQLASLNWDKTDFWYQYYVAFFKDINELNYSQSFVYFISNCKYNTEVLTWLARHHSQFREFVNWMEKQ